MTDVLAGKAVLVTGAAKGIGLETARLMHARGGRPDVAGLRHDLEVVLGLEQAQRAADHSVVIGEDIRIDSPIRPRD